MNSSKFCLGFFSLQRELRRCAWTGWDQTEKMPFRIILQRQKKKDTLHSVGFMCEGVLRQYSIKKKYRWFVAFWSFSSHIPVGCRGIQDYESLSGVCAHTFQSVEDRPYQKGCISEGMLGVAAADSLNMRCVDRSPGTLSSPETQTYRAEISVFC